MRALRELWRRLRRRAPLTAPARPATNVEALRQGMVDRGLIRMEGLPSGAIVPRLTAMGWRTFHRAVAQGYRLERVYEVRSDLTALDVFMACAQVELDESRKRAAPTGSN